MIADSDLDSGEGRINCCNDEVIIKCGYIEIFRIDGGFRLLLVSDISS